MKGKRLTLDPKSRRALFIFFSSIMQDIVGVPGSLSIGGSSLRIIALTWLARNAPFSTLVLLLNVHRSLMNLAYEGTCLITSSKERLIFTCLRAQGIVCSAHPIYPFEVFGERGQAKVGLLFQQSLDLCLVSL